MCQVSRLRPSSRESPRQARVSLMCEHHSGRNAGEEPLALGTEETSGPSRASLPRVGARKPPESVLQRFGGALTLRDSGQPLLAPRSSFSSTGNILLIGLSSAPSSHFLN